MSLDSEDYIEGCIYILRSSGSDSEESLTGSNNNLLPKSDNLRSYNDTLLSSVESVHCDPSLAPAVTESSDDDSDDTLLKNLIRVMAEVHADDAWSKPTNRQKTVSYTGACGPNRYLQQNFRMVRPLISILQ